MHLDLVTVVVDDYDAAIAFFAGTLGFDLVSDAPARTGDGRPKRWVVVRPPGAATGLLLARADGDAQRAVVGRQAGGRVGFFLRVDDVDAAHARLTAAGVEFAEPPRTEPYGRVAVFLDVAGNRWDLVGPDPADAVARVRALCLRLPGVEEGRLQDRPLFRVGRRRFALVNPPGAPDRPRWRGSGPSLHLLTDPHERDALAQDDRFSPSPHHGDRGWVAIRLDRDDLDWAELAELIDAAHRQVAALTRRGPPRK